MTEETKGQIAEVRKLVEDYTKPAVVTLDEPGTGVKVPAVLSFNSVKSLQPEVFDQYRATPLFRRGTAELLSLDSLIDHGNRFKDDGSAIFADDSRSAPALTIVLDYHDVGGPEDGTQRHGKHRSHFAFPLSDEWKAWTATNAQPMSMADFAVFLEERLPDVLDLIPDEDDVPEDLRKFINSAGGAGSIATSQRLLELSRGLQINENSAVKEVVKLSSGEGQVLFQSEHTDAAGAPLKVPSLFLIAIPVFRNGPLYRLVARLRYRKNGGIVFWYDLWRADRTFDHAFKESCERVRVETSLPLFFGRPE